LNSHGYQSLNGYMFGPVFDDTEQAAHNGANSRDCNNPSGYLCIDDADERERGRPANGRSPEASRMA
jgi:hypothetical protein